MKSHPEASRWFYLVAYVVIFGSLALGAVYVPWQALPFILIASVLGSSSVIAATLRHSSQLTEKGYLELMGGVLKRLVLLRREAPRSAGDLPEGGEGARPRAPARRPLPADRPKELPRAGEARPSGVRRRQASPGTEKERKRRD